MTMPPKTASPRRKKKAEPFVALQLDWAVKAAKATGTPKAVVWIRLLYLAWRQGERKLYLPNKWLKDQGISRFTKNRALNELEVGGLITVERRSRKSPRITLR
jgi:hypothetical protein